ncbi:MAG: epoxyqueuosine reductase, partial [Oscillospiraceae bacterium]|nr:epoxyqueuosine reductase [Oscillospiraceae bacterium]
MFVPKNNSPIREVTAAYLAGLGFVGKNGLLINEQLGSYHFITEIVTDLELSADRPLEKECGSCRLCLDACPLGALSLAGV